jgi:hypothetical protein
VFVNKLYNVSKELPLILANQKGATGAFIQKALLNEFKNTTSGGANNIINPIDWYDNGLSDKAILGALYNLHENGIPYVLRLFNEFKSLGINNERTRKISLGYIWGNPNIEFNAVKYRNKLKSILRHIYGVRKTSILLSIAEKLVNTGIFTDSKDVNIYNEMLGSYVGGMSNEKACKILLFIFKKGKAEYYTNGFNFINEYYKATVDITSTNKVPKEVLIGLISNKRHPQYDEKWSTEVKRKNTMAEFMVKSEVTSANQQVRETKKSKSLGVEKVIDYQKATDFLALYKTGYENGFSDEIKDAINKLAEKKVISLPYNSIGVILDKSESMKGHKQESKNTPRAIADFTSRVLKKSVDKFKITSTDTLNTDLATALVELLKKEIKSNPYQAIFVITDGYENSYDGLFNEVLNAYLSETNRFLPVFQVAPIVGAEMKGNIRSIGSEVLTMGVTNPTALSAQIQSRMLEADTKQWILNQVSILENSTYTRRITENQNV